MATTFKVQGNERKVKTVIKMSICPKARAAYTSHILIGHYRFQERLQILYLEWSSHHNI